MACAIGTGVCAQEFDYPNRYESTAETMLDWMDAMAEAYSRRRGRDDAPSQAAQPWSSWPSMPQGGGMPAMNPLSSGLSSMNPLSPWGGMSPMNPISAWPTMQPWGSTSPWASMPSWPQMPGAGQGGAPQVGPPSTSAPLDGRWEGAGGEFLIIRSGRFRVFLTREEYRDGEIRVSQSHVQMRDPDSDIVRTYEFALHEDRLALRDEEGNLLLYKRFSGD